MIRPLNEIEDIDCAKCSKYFPGENKDCDIHKAVFVKKNKAMESMYDKFFDAVGCKYFERREND